ncbi:putative ORFan [Tupanvirus deep ocean]|uniref:ORFan n=2 Tax=Tupanvirus TaxID=2094720 RepID=A0AC62A8H3_9VIRU|nr:putative ORFan [Tupanvirus deep ocean]QKU34070.1 putative ORFan [Tupanvirus deep ocean]
MLIRARPHIDFYNMKKFNDPNGDVDIESSDGKTLKGHSEILIEVSDFFRSKINAKKRIVINYNHVIIERVLSAAYYSIYEFTTRYPRLTNTTFSENIYEMCLIHKLHFKVEMHWYILRISMRLINKCSDIWLDFVKKAHNNPAFKKVINIFFQDYLNHNTKLKKITVADIESLIIEPNNNNTILVKNKELCNRLVSLVLEKDNREKLRASLKIESARKSFLSNESNKLVELEDSIIS